VAGILQPYWRRPIHAIYKESHEPDNLSDVTDILARKKEARREISRRSLGEKIAMVEAMRERLAPLKRIRGATCKSEIRRAELVLPRTKNLFAWIRDNTGTGHGV
jgi:phosphoserine phosphatase